MIITGSIPPVSACFHAKTSLFCFRKWVRRLLRSSVSLADVGEVFRVVVQRYMLQLLRGLRSGVCLVMHVELVQVYVVNRFLLHECRVTFPGHTLVPSNHSYSAGGKERDHHVVSGRNGCETPRKSNFLKKGKIEISVKIRNFSRPRMTKRTFPLKSSREV